MQKEECARSPPDSLCTNPSFSFNKYERLQNKETNNEDSMDQ